MKSEIKLITVVPLTLYQYLVISLTFLIPFLISGPQLLTGTLVNLLLIFGAKFTNKKYHILLAVIPSIAALLNGLVFGKFTAFLVFFLPIIWMGNFVFIKSINIFGKNLSMPLSISLGLIIKTLILFSSALLYFKLSLVPEIFLTSMGVFQLITGILGGLVFLLTNKFISNKNVIPA
jgi:hypothetical protein